MILLGAAVEQRAEHGRVRSPLVAVARRDETVELVATLREDPSGPQYATEALAAIATVNGRDAGGRTVLLRATGDEQSALRVLEAGDRVRTHGRVVPLSGFSTRLRWRHAVGEVEVERGRRRRRTGHALVRRGQRRARPRAARCGDAALHAARTAGRLRARRHPWHPTRSRGRLPRVGAQPPARGVGCERRVRAGRGGAGAGAPAPHHAVRRWDRGARALRHDDPLGAVGAACVGDGGSRDAGPLSSGGRPRPAACSCTR